MKGFFLCLLMLIGCASPQKPSSRLNISFNSHPNTTDPRKAADFISSTLVCMIYDGLTRCAPGGSVELALAERVEIKDTVYTFHLRNACWSNGKPVTAFDFARSWKEVVERASPCAFLFYPIKNAEKCARGEIGIEEVGIKALDARTFEVELERPTPYFYSLTAFPSFLAAPQDSADPSIANGPFKIEKMVHNSEIILKKNERYWNAQHVPIDVIHISIVPDETTALQMFEKGDLDWIGGALSPLPPDAIEKLREQIQFIPTAGSTICAFNTQRFPFTNKNLRKAFSFSINRSQIEGAQIPAKTILPPVFSDQSLNLHDPEEALLCFEKAIDELGINPQELEKLTLYFRGTQAEKRLAQTLQKQWKELFGITVRLAQLDFKTHAQKLQNKDFQIAIASWIAQFEDPVSILERFKYADHLKNYSGWANDAYFASLASASISKNRSEFLAEAEKILIDEAPITTIYHWSCPCLCSPKIKKIVASPCGGILFEKFEIAY